MLLILSTCQLNSNQLNDGGGGSDEDDDDIKVKGKNYNKSYDMPSPSSSLTHIMTLKRGSCEDNVSESFAIKY